MPPDESHQPSIEAPANLESVMQKTIESLEISNTKNRSVLVTGFGKGKSRALAFKTPLKSEPTEGGVSTTKYLIVAMDGYRVLQVEEDPSNKHLSTDLNIFLTNAPSSNYSEAYGLHNNSNEYYVAQPVLSIRSYKEDKPILQVNSSGALVDGQNTDKVRLIDANSEEIERIMLLNKEQLEKIKREEEEKQRKIQQAIEVSKKIDELFS